MDIKMLKAKNLQDGLKRGMTVSDFCEKYDCSPEELEIQIGNLYKYNTSKAKEFMDQMEANSKKARPKKVEPEVQTEAVEDECITVVEAEVEEESVPTTETVVSVHTAELEELENSDKILSREVMDLEAQHEDLSNQHRGCLNQIREIRKELVEIEAAYNAKCIQCESIIQDNNDVVAQMNDISAKLREKRAVLDETRQKIAELKKLTVFVYSDGGIYVNDARVDEDILLDEVLFGELLAKPECEELKLKEVKTLTKMLTFARSSTLPVEVTCENEDLEIVYLEFV